MASSSVCDERLSSVRSIEFHQTSSCNEDASRRADPGQATTLRRMALLDHRNEFFDLIRHPFDQPPCRYQGEVSSSLRYASVYRLRRPPDSRSPRPVSGSIGKLRRPKNVTPGVKTSAFSAGPGGDGSIIGVEAAERPSLKSKGRRDEKFVHAAAVARLQGKRVCRDTGQTILAQAKSNSRGGRDGPSHLARP